MNKSMMGAIAICFAAILWGLDGVALTPKLFTLSPIFVVFLLHAVPFMMMQPFLFSSYKKLLKLPKENMLFLFLAALAGGLIGTIAIVKALFLVHFQKLSIVMLLQKLQPVFAIFFAAIILKERLSKKYVFWAAISLIGAYMLTFGIGVPIISDDYTSAALFAVLAAASFGSATVFGKKVLEKTDFKSATFGRFGLTALFAAILVPFLGAFTFDLITNVQWGLLILIAITTGSGAIFIYYWGLNRVTAITSIICELCMPLSAVIFDYFINNTMLEFWQLVGIALMIVSIIMISKDSEKRAIASDSSKNI